MYIIHIKYSNYVRKLFYITYVKQHLSKLSRREAVTSGFWDIFRRILDPDKESSDNPYLKIHDFSRLTEPETLDPDHSQDPKHFWQ